jgi:hypothetical protein
MPTRQVADGTHSAIIRATKPTSNTPLRGRRSSAAPHRHMSGRGGWVRTCPRPIRASAASVACCSGPSSRRSEFGGDAAPGHAGAAFGHTYQQQRQPAQQHLAADAVFDRPQQQAGLQVEEPALGFEQVLVSEGGVLGADVRACPLTAELGWVSLEARGRAGSDLPICVRCGLWCLSNAGRG